MDTVRAKDLSLQDIIMQMRIFKTLRMDLTECYFRSEFYITIVLVY